MSPGSRNRAFPEEQDRLIAKKPFLDLRARMLQSIRAFFVGRGYLEVETPQLITAPTPEVHIDAIPVGTRYLHTSPELAMKRLLAAGYTRIFQVCKCFRQGEHGRLHLPEFTLLEWYHSGIDYRGLMEECKSLIIEVSVGCGGGEKITYQGHIIELLGPWDRVSVSQAFDRYASISMKASLEQGIFDEVMVREIEPCLGMTRPTFLYDYPAPLGALARLKRQEPELAERFEIYLGGMELANGFSELTDVQEQRIRFERDRQARRNLGKPLYPMPERFLAALKHMPDAAGIALGVDRLTMILADRAQIDDVVCFAPEDL
jgi:lysyl-tRNA synthetase class 2